MLLGSMHKFLGRGGGMFCWEDLARGEFSMEREVFRVELFRGNLTLREFESVENFSEC